MLVQQKHLLNIWTVLNIATFACSEAQEYFRALLACRQASRISRASLVCREAQRIFRVSICMLRALRIYRVPICMLRAQMVSRVPICMQAGLQGFQCFASMQGGPKGSAMSSSQQTGQWRGPAASAGPCCWTGRSSSTQLPMAAAPSPLSPASQWRAAGSASATLLQTQTLSSALVRHELGCPVYYQLLIKLLPKGVNCPLRPVALYSRHSRPDCTCTAFGKTCYRVQQTLDTTADIDLVVSIGET